MSDTLTNEQRVRLAFPPPPSAHARMAQAIVNAYANSDPVSVNGYIVQLLAPGIANVTDNGVTLLVQDGYCAHCRTNGDGEALCRHKEALFEAERGDAQDQYETYRDALDVGIQ